MVDHVSLTAIEDTNTNTDTDTDTDQKQNVQIVSANNEHSVAAQDSLALAKRVGTSRGKRQTLEHVAGWQPRSVST